MNFIFNGFAVANITHPLCLLGSSKQRVLQNSVNILRRLVYTAARVGAVDFIRMVFTSSAGRIVFKTYKNNYPLPEEIAVANAHPEVAAYLQAITERYEP